MLNVTKGLSYPLSFGANGGLARSSGSQKILANIKNIVTTRLGERYMARDLGTNIASHLFSNIGSIPFAVLATDVRTAIQRYEPRVQVISVQIKQSESEESTLKINIIYKVKTLGLSPEVSLDFEV